MTGQYDFSEDGPIIDAPFNLREALREDSATLFADEPELAAEESTPAAIAPDLFKTPPLPRGAKEYQRKSRVLVSTATRLTLNPATLADSAALVIHGPKLADSVGILATHDPRVARGIDMLTEGAENPYLAVVMAAAPLILQMVRNHEPVAEPEVRGIKIPFIKRTIKVRFNVKLGNLRNITNDPEQLKAYVFNDEAIQAALVKQGVNLDSLFRPRPERKRRGRRANAAGETQ